MKDFIGRKKVKSTSSRYFSLFLLILIFAAAFFLGMKEQTSTLISKETAIKELTPVLSRDMNPNFEFEIIKISGNYVAGGAGYPTGSGWRWIVMKRDNKWEIIWTGVNIISCKIVQQYSIPKEIYGEECSSSY